MSICQSEFQAEKYQFTFSDNVGNIQLSGISDASNIGSGKINQTGHREPILNIQV